MSNQTVHRRYAKALFDEGHAANILPKVDEDAAFVQSTVAEHRDLALLLDSPVISKEKKQAVLKALFEDKVEPLTLKFVRMIVRKEREAELQGILNSFQQLRDEESGVVVVQVKVAVELDADAEAAVTSRLERVVDGTVRLETTVDESLIGGLIVRIGDVVYNGSVRHHLVTLRERMKQGASVSNVANGSA